ncbi:hypothetical protein V7201_12740 [Bacillus sp. JJ1122]
MEGKLAKVIISPVGELFSPVEAVFSQVGQNRPVKQQAIFYHRLKYRKIIHSISP